jgi:hypothetical protein
MIDTKDPDAARAALSSELAQWKQQLSSLKSKFHQRAEARNKVRGAEYWTERLGSSYVNWDNPEQREHAEQLEKLIGAALLDASTTLPMAEAELHKQVSVCFVDQLGWAAADMGPSLPARLLGMLAAQLQAADVLPWQQLQSPGSDLDPHQYALCISGIFSVVCTSAAGRLSSVVTRWPNNSAACLVQQPTVCRLTASFHPTSLWFPLLQLLAGPNGLSYQSHVAGMKLNSAKKPLLRLAVGDSAISICAVTIGASNHMFVTGIDRDKLCRWVKGRCVRRRAEGGWGMGLPTMRVCCAGLHALGGVFETTAASKHTLRAWACCWHQAGTQVYMGVCLPACCAPMPGRHSTAHHD